MALDSESIGWGRCFFHTQAKGRRANSPAPPLPSEGSGAEVAGSMTVDMRDFAIDPPSISFTQAEPAVTIEFDLKLVHA